MKLLLAFVGSFVFLALVLIVSLLKAASVADRLAESFEKARLEAEEKNRQ